MRPIAALSPSQRRVLMAKPLFAKYLFREAAFVKTATHPTHYPALSDPHGQSLPEIATAGRSNVGKSSLLNHLFQCKGLVKTSSTPGKTQALNFFIVNQQLSFVDLPGYGYANVPDTVKAKWGPLTETYLRTRTPLKLILFLLDIRRQPNADDLRFLEWVVHNQKAMILVLTKVDQLSKNEVNKRTQEVLSAFPYENLYYTHYSVTKNIGRNALIHLIQEALQDELQEDELQDESPED
jgi:GTP-binding protein